MKILAIDPGKTCGIAKFKNGEFLEDEVAELTEKELLLDIETDKPDLIIVEGYYHYPWVKNRAIHNYPVAELIGKIKFLAQKLDLRVIIQPSGMVKSVITKAVLKHFKIKDYKSKHIRDAIKHGLYYIKYRKH